MKGRLLKAIGVLSVAISSMGSAVADIHFKDVIGSDVHLEKPAESIFLGFYFEDYLDIAGPDSYNKVSIFPLYSLKDSRLTSSVPSSQNLPQDNTNIR